MKMQRWPKLLVITEIEHNYTILLNAKTRSIPSRIVNLVW